MEHGGWMGWGGGFMWLFWVLLGVVIIAVIRAMAGGDHPSREENALEILRRRYALGEIDDEEYERRRKKLEEGKANG